MNRADLIKQARILANRGTDEFSELLALSCQFKVKYRCQGKSYHLEFDPTGETRLPAPACNNCHAYLERAYHQSIASEEANMRIKLAILATYEAMMEWGN